jgi:hypothetical protein
MPGIEGLKSSNALVAQIITVSAGLLAFTVTFVDKFTPKEEPPVVPYQLKLSWLFLVLTIIVGFWTTGAITGTLNLLDRGVAESNEGRTNILYPARFMVATLVISVGCLIWAGWSITR